MYPLSGPKRPIRIRYVVMSIPIMELSPVLCTVQAFVLSYFSVQTFVSHNTWANLWSFRGFSSKTQSSFILSTITEQWKFSYRIFTYIQNEIYPFWMDPYKLWFHCPLTIQKSVSQKSQNHLFSIKRVYHKKSTPGNRIGVACTGRLICAFVVQIWQNRFSHDVTHFQIDRSYLCRIRKKEFVASNFTVQELCWFSLSDFTLFTNDLTPTGRL